MGKLYEVTCKRCGLTWTPRVERPKKCLRCGSTDWDKLKTARKK